MPSFSFTLNFHPRRGRPVWRPDAGSEQTLQGYAKYLDNGK